MIFKLAQIGFLIGTAILVCMVIYNYPLIVGAFVCLGILWLTRSSVEG